MDASMEIARLREEIASLRWTNESLEKENVRLQSELDYMTEHANYTDTVTTEYHGQSSQFGNTLNYWRDREQVELEVEGTWQDDSFNSGRDEETNDRAAVEHEVDDEDYAQVEQEDFPAPVNHWDFDHDRANCEECNPELLKSKPDITWYKVIKEELSTDAQEAFIDHDFYITPAAVVWLPWEEQYSTIHKAHQIAKQAFWYAYRHHWPEKALQRFPWHWDQVRFGLTEIDHSGLGTREYPDYSCQMCGQTRETVWYGMSVVTELRNAVCHPSGPLTVGNVCGLVNKARKLTEMLGDDARVHELRLLQWEVMRKAQDVYKQIEASVGTTWCTGPRNTDTKLQRRARRAFVHGAKSAVQGSTERATWPFYIQYLLDEVTRGLAGNRQSREKFQAYPHAILEAARLWSEKGLSAGEGDTDYQQRGEESREWVKDAKTEPVFVESNLVEADKTRQPTAEPDIESSRESVEPFTSLADYSKWLCSHHAEQQKQ